jgi:AraC-like DNA-binding protein
VYRERRSRIDGAVVWTAPGSPGETRVLPDGCIDLILVDGGILVAGPDTTAHLAARGMARTGIRFAPGTAPAVLGIPAHHLRDRRVPLDAVWPAHDARLATDRVAAAASAGRGLEDLAADRLGMTDPGSGALRATVRALAAGYDIGSIATALGITARQLHRRSLDAFGYGPKLLTRVLRMQRALALTRGGASFADGAARAGYADQAHLARDVKALAGVPLGTLIR